MVKPASLYFHIPFCKKKCPYCHFFSYQNNEKAIPSFLLSLKKEWLQKRPLLKDYEIISIYFGGGTPSLLNPEQIEQILKWIFSSVKLKAPIEITCEMNPEDVTEELVQQYAQIGINRISLGVQSFLKEDLHFLQRNYTFEKAFNACKMIEKTISNYSIDLLYDLPYQTEEKLEKTFSFVEKLNNTHLSLYNLVIEPKTPFFYRKKELALIMPSQEKSKELLDFSLKKLKEIGFIRYEISAFCKKGLQSIHNMGYWQGRSFLGYGPSSFSYFENRRFSNVSSLYLYEEKLQNNLSPQDFEETLSITQRQAELLAIHLRILEGMDIEEFQKENGIIHSLLLSKIQKLIQKKLIIKTSTHLKLTEMGALFYDDVAEELIEG